MNTSKINLSNVIFLDSYNVYLPWGINCEDAWKIGIPNFLNFPDDKTRIVWTSSVFSRLNCEILAYLPNNSKLDQVTLWPKVIDNSLKLRALEQYNLFGSHLEALFGKPQEISTEGTALKMTIKTWSIGKCTLQLYTGETMDEFTLLDIIKDKTPRFVS